MLGALPVLSVSRMREVDAAAIAEDLPLLALMESAGRGAFTSYRRRWGLAPLHLLVGPGHNGADALAMGRMAAAHGARVVAWGDRDALGEAGRLQWRLAEREGVAWSGRPAADLGDGSGVVADGLLGTGARGAPRKGMAALVAAANAAGWKGRLALDAPTGVDMDTGAVAGEAFSADATVTFAFLKPGLLLYPGAGNAGEVEVVDIGISRHRAESPDGWLVTRAACRALVPAFRVDGHKGVAGRVGVWAGSAAFPGAARLAVEGALRSGAGVVHWTGRDEGMPPEVIQEGKLPSEIRDLDAWAIGPGLGREKATLEAVAAEVAKLKVPAVLDADALAAFAADPESLAGHPAPRVLTPHHAEAAALLGRPVGAVEADRPAAARDLARRTGQIVLLKGLPTLVAAGGDPLLYLANPAPALAHGGTGDVLAGLLGGLLAQGMEPAHAAAVGGWLHGRAGALWHEQGRPRQTATASELAAQIETAWQELLRG